MEGNNKHKTRGFFCLLGLVFLFERQVGQDQKWIIEVFVSVLEFVVSSGFIDAFRIIKNK